MCVIARVCVGEQTYWLCMWLWRIEIGYILGVEVPIYSVMCKGVSWTKGWDILSCREKNCQTISLISFHIVSRIRGHLLKRCVRH